MNIQTFKKVYILLLLYTRERDMAYKIAVGSLDGINVDLKFGEVSEFLIYEITDEIRLIEKRKVNSVKADNINTNSTNNSDNTNTNSTNESNNTNNACTNGSSHNRCCGNGNGCGSQSIIPGVTLIEDCRCVVCKKIGFQAQKQFEKKAITVFDVDTSIDDALTKITAYYAKIDSRKHSHNSVNS